jgi:hypothetical protein
MKRLLISAALCAAASAHGQTVDIPDRRGVPDWEIPAGFEDDVFTFARLRPEFHSKWHVDYPDSDLNFSYRLHEMTALKVNPNPRLIAITSPELPDFPFVYIVEPGGLHLSRQEASILRTYLLNGGFLMFDDFWRESEWSTVYAQVKAIFPDREPVELDLDHPIFHTVFDIREKPQIPAINIALAGRAQGITWERGANPYASFYGIFDDQGRMMVVICRDTDLGDGWEREGDDAWFFREFSEKKAYPMGINIVVYALTH